MFKEGLACCPKPGRNRSCQDLQAQELAELVRLKMKSSDWRRVLATSDFVTGTDWIRVLATSDFVTSREIHGRQEEGLMAEQQGGRGPQGGQTADRGGVSEEDWKDRATGTGSRKRVAPGDGEDQRVGTERQPMEGRPRNQEGGEKCVGGVSSQLTTLVEAQRETKARVKLVHPVSLPGTHPSPA